MQPQPPKRADSAKFSGHSSSYVQPLHSIEGYRSFGQLPNFVVESSLGNLSSAVGTIVPPLASYTPTTPPVKLSGSGMPNAFQSHNGYMSKDFHSDNRHMSGITSMTNLTYTPPNSIKKNAIDKVLPIVPETIKVHKVQVQNVLQPEPKLSKKSQNSKESEFSVDDFISKLLGFDEATMDRSHSKNRKSFYPKPDDNDINKGSLNEVLRVSFLDEEKTYKSFAPPKSVDFDPEMKDRASNVVPARRDSGSISEKYFEKEYLAASEVDFCPPTRFDSEMKDTELYQVPLRTYSRIYKTSGRNDAYQVPSVDGSISSSSTPSPVETSNNFTNSSLSNTRLSFGPYIPSDVEKSPSAFSPTLLSVSPVEDIVMSPMESDKFSMDDSFSEIDKYSSVSSSVKLDRTISTTDSSSSSSASVVVENYKPTFQTLRRNKSAQDESFARNTQYIPSDASFADMKATAKKENNPQVLFDFAKFCIQLGDPYADTGLSFLQKLAKSGFNDAQFVLGQAHADDGRYDIAFRYFSAASKRNHYQAAYEAGYLCEHGGSGIKKNEREALNYYTKAASSGHKKAMYRLAVAELYGQLGLKRNINNGLKWLNRGEAVADIDCPEPLYELSLIYEVGIHPVVLSDPKHSLALLREAANFQYPPALYKLGYYYEYGYLDVEIDTSRSISLYQESAKAGNREAQLALSGWLLSGHNNAIVKNEREAFYWAHLSALQGLPRAEYTMGYYFESGIGVSASRSEALKWYQAAARQEDEMAIKRLTEIGHFSKSQKHKRIPILSLISSKSK